MKKLKILLGLVVMFVMFQTIVFAEQVCTKEPINDNSCPAKSTFYGKLRFEQKYGFNDYFYAKGGKNQITNIAAYINEQCDYNNSTVESNKDFFYTTDDFRKRKGVLPSRSDPYWIVTSNDYEVVKLPPKRDDHNLLVKYVVSYNVDGGSTKIDTECKYYAITRCGDGIVDKPGDGDKWEAEICDPKDPKKEGWGEGGCDDTCKPVKKAVCNSDFNGKKVETLTEGNHLCTEGTYSEFYNDTLNHRWTWKCNNKLGNGVNCSAIQPYCGDGIVDKGEKCDPKDPKKEGWGNGGCDVVSCTPINVGDPVCNSQYNGQRLKDLKEGNHLCTEGTYSGFEYKNNLHKWIWKCNNKLGEGVECFASKPYCGDKVIDEGEECDGSSDCSDDCKKMYCGDGIKNNGEECDPKDPKKEGWGSKGCNEFCEQEFDVDVSCTQAFKGTLRCGSGYTFPDEFIAGTDRWMYDFDVYFKKGYDINAGEPKFSWTQTLLKNNMLVKAGQTMTIIEASQPYIIKNCPKNRSYDNLYIEYTTVSAGEDYKGKSLPNSKLSTHKECVNYEISRCGDGVLDEDYGEECDPGSEGTKTLPNGKVCNSECKIENGNGKLVIEKTLVGSTGVVNAGDTITWSLKITASGGDVTNFIVTDDLPEVLEFDSYSIPNSLGLKVSNPITGGSDFDIKWNVEGTLKQGETLEIRVVTKAKWMPEKDYVNVACVAPADNPEDKDCDKKPLPSVGTLDIQKTLISKSKYVTGIGQELEWKITVRAINGYTGVKRIEDRLPDELTYVSSKVVHNPSGIKVGEGKPSDDNRVRWQAEGVLLSGEYIEINLLSKVVKMSDPNKEVVNVACVKPMTGGELCDTGHVSNVWIEKHILDTDGKEKDFITGSVGDTITYKIHFGNNGDERVSVVLKDFLPKSVKFKSGELIVSSIKAGGDVSTGIFDMEYEGVKIKIDGVEINKYTNVYLNPGEKGVLTVVGEILTPKDEKENRTNFACIYDENEKVIDCDDAHHNVVSDENKCEKLNVPSGDLPNRGGSKEVTCTTTSGEVAEYIQIDCGNGVSITGENKSSLTGTCAYPSGKKTYTLVCKVKINGKEYTSDSCKGSVSVEGTSGCFPAKTKVTMANGTKKNIEDVKEGDVVLSYNVNTNTNEENVVKRRIVHEEHFHEMYELTINGNVLKVTDVHPFYVRKLASSQDYAWIEAQNLKVGDILLMSDGRLVEIEKINHYSNVETVYNLEVDGNHDYFVDEGYLVHNKGGTTCFIAGTKVTMADGTQKNIEDVKIGEKVLGSNGVVNTVLGYDRPILGERHLWSINGSEYFVSDEHPFMTTQGWKSFNPEMTKLEVNLDTTELKVGDILVTNNGLEEIKSVDYINADYDTPLYNFALDGDHTYYANNYLVHNKCTTNNCEPTEDETTDYCKDEKKKGENYNPACDLANPHCFNVNEGNFSIEVGEYLPFYFNVYRDTTAGDDPVYKYKFVKNENEECKLGEVDLGSLKCRYVIRKPQVDRRNGTDIVYSSGDIQCLSLDGRDNQIKSDSLIGKWIDAQKKLYDIDFDDNGGEYRPMIEVTDSNDWTKNRNWDDTLGEYQFQIEVYEYRQCTEEGTQWKDVETTTINETNIGVCQSNFVLTEPYTVQKTPSGNLRASTVTLAKFKQVDGMGLTDFSSYLNAIQTTQYHPNDKVNQAMDAFINKYKKLAVKVNLSSNSFLEGVNVSKVPGKHIYFVDGDITVKGGTSNIETPFTIVQTRGTTTIKGDVNHNMMLLTNGNIVFKGSCTENQKVRGIFYAKGGLEREGVGKNTSLENKEWCTKGGLNVKGVLIGSNFNGLMTKSRSHLETWFNRDGSRNGTDSQALAKKVMDGASVVIEYSPSIFTKSTMPPGAEDFTTALSIYKN